MEHCCHLFDFVIPALELLIAKGLITDDATGDLMDYDDEEALYAKASQLVKDNQDEPDLLVMLLGKYFALFGCVEDATSVGRPTVDRIEAGCLIGHFVHYVIKRHGF